MAITKEINIVANTSSAVSNIDKVTKSTDNLEKSTNEVNTNLESMEESASSSAKGVKSVGGSLSNLKLGALGLIVATFAALKSILEQNQKVVDFFEGSMTAVTTVVNSVVNSVIQAGNGFASLGKVLSGLITVAITPFKAAFFGIRLAVLETQKAWEESVFGGKDQKTIDDLNSKIKETKDSLTEVATDLSAGVSDIANNFVGAINEIGASANAVVKTLEETSIKAAAAEGKRLIALQKNAEIAQARNTGLIEQYDAQAEKLRQLRDDDAASISDRVKANNELGDVLEKQFVAMQKNADIVLENAEAQFKANETQENYIALIEAQNEKLAINAQIEGFRSEQIVNNVALKKEEIELGLAQAESEEQRRINELNFEAEREENETTRIQRLKESLEIESQIADDKLERDKKLFKEGTQARIDAEQEYLNRKQELNQTEILLDDKLKDAKEKNADSTAKVLDELSNVAGENTVAAKGLAIASATINTYRGVSDALAATTVTPFDTALKFANAAAIAVTGFKNVSDITKVKIPNEAGGAQQSASASAPSVAAPSFNLIEGTEGSNVANAVNTNNDTPVKAFVVSSEITTSQELDRRIDDVSST